MLLLLLLILFCRCYQQQQLSGTVRFIATLHVTIQPLLTICKATFTTFVAQRSDVKVSESTLYGQTKARDFTFKERTVPYQGVLAAEAGTSGFAQCNHCLLKVKTKLQGLHI